MNSMAMSCKCHGVSGACNVQTCLKRLSNFKAVGDMLRKEYDTAAKVRPVQVSRSRRITRDHLSPDETRSHSPTQSNLVYFEESPDFCTPNISQGSLGTYGRYCNGSLGAEGVDGCELLCCGRTWKTETLTKVENCKCVFTWCCKVTCQSCRITRQYSYCL